MYHFTNEEVRKSFVHEKIDPVTQEVVDAHHLNLEGHIPVSQQTWAEADQLREKLGEGKKENPEADQGPATALGGLIEGIGDFAIKSIESNIKVSEDHAPVLQQICADAGQLREKLDEGKKGNSEADDGPATALGGLIEGIEDFAIKSIESNIKVSEDHAPVLQQICADAGQLREKLDEGKKGNSEADGGPATATGGLIDNLGDLDIKSMVNDVKTGFASFGQGWF